MRGYDAFAGVIKSGGKTRRAAKMVILNADHPDIVEFINCKAEEERKAWALIDAGYEGAFNVQGRRLRLRVLPERQPLRAGHRRLHARGGRGPRVADEVRALRGSPARPTSARDLMKMMAEAAWQCGDPGMQFDTTINDWHTCPNTARINASNPCSEYMFLDDTACNLSSLNLMKFRKEDGEFDTEAFKAACRTMITAQEILVDNASYPTPAIDRNSPRLPAPGPRLRQPRRAAHGPRPALRQRRGPGLRGRHHRPHARRGLRAERAGGLGHGPLRGLREERRAHAAGHRQAPPARAHDRLDPGAPGGAADAPSPSGTRPTPSASSTATATARSRCSPPPAPSAS